MSTTIPGEWGGGAPMVAARPKFYLLDSTEYIRNRNAVDNIRCWTPIDGATVVRQQDATCFHGDYCISVEDDNAGAAEYAEHEIWCGNSYAGMTWMASFWARKPASTGLAGYYVDYKVHIDGTWISDRVQHDSSDWRHYTAMFYIPSGLAGATYFDFQVYPGVADAAATGTVYLSSVRFRKVLAEYTLPWPTMYNLTWDRVLQANHQRIDGSEDAHVDGYRAKVATTWAYLDADDEVGRTEISEAAMVMMYLHGDGDWQHLMRWNGDYERNYFGDVMVGHPGRLAFTSIDFFPRPTIAGGS